MITSNSLPKGNPPTALIYENAALDKSNGNVRAVQRLSRHADLRTVQLYDDNRINLQEQMTDLLEDALEDN